MPNSAWLVGLGGGGASWRKHTWLSVEDAEEGGLPGL